MIGELLNNPAIQAILLLLIPVIGIVLYAFPRLGKDKK